VNVALYATQAISAFRKPAWRLLGLPQDAVLRRPVFDGTRNRPDYLVEVEGQAWRCLEVELDTRRDSKQERNYLASFGLPTLWLVGRGGNRQGDPTLEAVAQLAVDVRRAIEAADPHAAELLRALVAAIADGLAGHRPRPQEAPVPHRLLAEPWFANAAAPLLELHRAGLVINRPTHPDSLSLRLRARPPVVRTSSGELALLSQRLDATSVVRVPAPDELERTLTPQLAGWIAGWRELLDMTCPEWKMWVDGASRVELRVEAVAAHASQFATIFAALRDHLLSPPCAPEMGA
jgi:hypothetical protein